MYLRSAIPGHASSETTKIFAIPSVDQLRSAIEKGQPKLDEELMWMGEEDEMKAIVQIAVFTLSASFQKRALDQAHLLKRCG